MVAITDLVMMSFINLLFIEARLKLGTSERRVKELEFMVKWAEVEGDLDLAKKTLEDLE